MARTMIGKVASNSMQKTVVVTVEALKTHPIYKKQYKTTARFHAHDETNELPVGTMVEIAETRPMSRMKRFTVVRTLDAPGAGEKKSKKTTKKEDQS
jgi:small subunit ribosomal protein S17